ncbi:MAG TPA: hypothetical protein VMY99_04465 [Nevskiaceae bacterium]|nr:hypothetical protein [Nevskiaceae bacterium]
MEQSVTLFGFDFKRVAGLGSRVLLAAVLAAGSSEIVASCDDDDNNEDTYGQLPPKKWGGDPGQDPLKFVIQGADEMPLHVSAVPPAHG